MALEDDLDLTHMKILARQIVHGLKGAGFNDLHTLQIIAMAEETGEFVGAARRFMGMARRSGTYGEMAAELADVVITAFITAEVFGIDLEQVIPYKAKIILTRGWREEVNLDS